MGAEMSTQARAKKPTHEDWQKARDRRGSSARKTVRALLDGNNGAAMEHARDWDEHDDEMFRISQILDGPGEAEL
jgi:hypothetical protein